MKAVFVTRFGPPDVLRFQSVPIPEPGESQLLIKVKAIGLNFSDIFARLGVYPAIPDPPFIPGLEISGIVDKTGPRVRNWKRGVRAFAIIRQGAYAEYVCVNERQTLPIPGKMTFEEAAAIGVTYLTAYHGLITLANMRKGEKLLLHAAAGGVGTAAIQIAKHLGVEVYGTAGSEKKLEIAGEQGMDHGINYRKEDFAGIIREMTRGYGVDVVMDSVGGKVFRKSWGLVAPMGRYVLYGFASAAGERRLNRLKALREMASVPFIYPPFLVSKNVGFFGFNLYFLMDKLEYLTGILKQVLKLYQQKVVKPVIGARFNFDDVIDAHRLLQSRQSFGKVVMLV